MMKEWKDKGHMNSEAGMSRKDIHWINYVRAFCIILIYFVHAEEFFGYTINGFDKYLLPIYVNAFYFVSGYLLFRRQLTIIEKNDHCKERHIFLTKILFRLVIPSILFSVLIFIPSVLIQNREFTILWFVEKTLGGNTYWFISSLVVAQLLFFILFQTRINNIWFYFIVSLGFYFLGALIISHNVCLVPGFESNPWNLEKGLISMVFLAFGGLYWKYEAIVDRHLQKNGIVICEIIIYILALHLYHSNIRVLISMGDINIFGVMVSILGICIIVYLCKMIAKNCKCLKLLDLIGQNTIGLYFVCGAIPKTMAIIVSKIFHLGNALYMLFGFIFSFIVSCSAVWLLKRFTPFLFDLRSGYRKRE